MKVEQIDHEDFRTLKQAVEINNERWTGRPATLDEFSRRARYGILLGIFDGHKLVGSLSALALKKTTGETVTTWKDATANGTLESHDSRGEILFCVAISVKAPPNFVKQPTKHFPPQAEIELRKLARNHIETYVNQGNDPVLDFHRKPKGGFLTGATRGRILENGCPEDLESMGYNVFMEYPPIEKEAEIPLTENEPAFQLIEMGFKLAQQLDISQVTAFSRPVGFRKYLRVNLLPRLI